MLAMKSLLRFAVAGFALVLLHSTEAVAGDPLLPVVDSEAFTSVQGVAICPDGTSVYAINFSSIRVFARDPLGGTLTVVETENGNDEGGTALACSPDGLHVYALDSGNQRVGSYTRSGVDGSLTFFDAIGTALQEPSDIAITPDGMHVVVAYANDPGAVGGTEVYARNPSTGVLSRFDELDDGGDPTDPVSVAISPDGRFLYIGGFQDSDGNNPAIGIVERLLPSGSLLAPVYESDDVPNRPQALTISPDGAHLYAVIQSQLSVFERDPATGELLLVEELFDGVDGVDGLSGGRDVVVSAEGTLVYVAGTGDDAVAAFRRNPADGTLAFLGVQGSLGGAQSLAASGPVEVEGQEDVSHLYVAARQDSEVVGLLALDETPFSGGSVGGDDLFVADRPTGLLIRSERFTGEQAIVNIGASLMAGELFGVAVADTLDFFVTQGATPKVVQVDPFTGLESAAASAGTPLQAPYDVAVEATGTLLVTDPMAFSPALQIARIDVGVGETFPVITGDVPSQPYGIAIGPKGDIFVVDGGSPPGVVRIDPATFVASVLSTGVPFDTPRGIAVRGDGQIFISDMGAFGSAGILQVDSQSGLATEVVSGAPLDVPAGLAFDSVGGLYVADGTRILRVFPGAGVAVPLAAPSLLTGAVGLATVPPAVIEAFGDYELVIDDLGEVVGSKRCYQIEDGQGKVGASVSGSRAKSAEVKGKLGDPKAKSWEFKSDEGQPDGDGALMVGEIPGCTAGEKTGEYAEYFRNPRKLGGAKLNTKARKVDEGGTDVLVARLRLKDADGKEMETTDFVLPDDFATFSVDIESQKFPNGVDGATSVDLDRIVGIGITIGKQGGGFAEAATVEVDDVTIVPEAGGAGAALLALLGLARARRARSERFRRFSPSRERP
jgi:6-phosphogluconolactonase (cycloisomerase 2 family)